jgi:hypothetical protein
MAVYSVFMSSRKMEGGELDKVLRVLFNDVYRIGHEFWLVDTAREADEIYSMLRPVVSPNDKLFIAGITRDFFPLLSRAALNWLTAPGRSWSVPRHRPVEDDASGPAFADFAPQQAIAA